MKKPISLSGVVRHRRRRYHSPPEIGKLILKPEMEIENQNTHSKETNQ
jgi:hypothetical protein